MSGSSKKEKTFIGSPFSKITFQLEIDNPEKLKSCREKGRVDVVEEFKRNIKSVLNPGRVLLEKKPTLSFDYIAPEKKTGNGSVSLGRVCVKIRGRTYPDPYDVSLIDEYVGSLCEAFKVPVRYSLPGERDTYYEVFPRSGKGNSKNSSNRNFG